MSFVQKIRLSNASNVCLILSQDVQGRSCYFYLRIHPAKKELVKRLDPSRVTDLTHYGEVIASGFGESPTTELQAQMKMEHGFEE